MPSLTVHWQVWAQVCHRLFQGLATLRAWGGGPPLAAAGETRRTAVMWSETVYSLTPGPLVTAACVPGMTRAVRAQNASGAQIQLGSEHRAI